MNIARTTRIYYTNNGTTLLNAQRDCGLLTYNPHVGKKPDQI